MEHRYKATELARALRQMDVKYHPAQEGTSDFIIQNGMLLVLLDEMNLARVEYYFSELLSKLEMRSRAQLDDEKMYERSSIQVQAGSLKDGDEDQNRPLFVGYNVVFVGTMNEDESTQALSIKYLIELTCFDLASRQIVNQERLKKINQTTTICLIKILGVIGSPP